MSRRIGILTGGGDCPGLNAVIRAVVKNAIGERGWDVIGIEDGFQGAYERRFHKLTTNDVRGLLTRGGTILGSSNRAHPFKYPIKNPDGSEEVRDVSDEIIRNIAAEGIEGIICVGGEGTMMMAQALFEKGLKIVGVPKTIDNDLGATDYTFGFQTAVQIATEAIDRLHTTAESHDRVMLCEVMGRYAGWLALSSGLAGGADVILIPEIPYKLDKVREAVQERSRRGITFSIIVVAEGAKPEGGELAVVRKADPTQQEKLGGAAERLAAALRSCIDHEIRVTVLGHVQRGGTPSAFDRLLGTRFGSAAVELIAENGWGRMVRLDGIRIDSVTIKEAAGNLKLVDPDGQLAQVAREMGVSLGA